MAQKMTCPCTTPPQLGDQFVCESCGMSLTITKGCGCGDPACVCLACCGTAMTKVEAPTPAG
jgi:hypothetical protein